jgi:chemotaxis protein MotB
VAELRTQLGSLQSLLDSAASRDEAAQVRIEALGSQLNLALARVASEERRRAALEEAERIRLEEEARRLAEEARNLESYRSEFFGALRAVLGDVEGVQIVGDRFLFSSEVLFPSGASDLLPEGRAQIAQVAQILAEVSDDIPEGIDWILRVDGHTDNIPVSGGAFADNWELSQARALSVVRYMVNQLGFPPERLAATGFGEYRPVNPANTPEARAQNRRIELKLTER